MLKINTNVGMCCGSNMFLWDSPLVMVTLCRGLKMQRTESGVLPVAMSCFNCLRVECGCETRWMISVILLWCSAKEFFFLLLKVAQVLWFKTCPSFASVFVRTCLLVLSKGLSCSLWTDNSQMCHQTKKNMNIMSRQSSFCHTPLAVCVYFLLKVTLNPGIGHSLLWWWSGAMR